MPTFRVTKLDPDAHLPDRVHEDDAGLDLYSVHEVHIGPGRTQKVHTGISIEIPRGYGGFIQPRSGLASKYGITVLNSPGLIDSGYRGEVIVLLHNTTRYDPYVVAPNDRIAQLVIIACNGFTPIEVETLSETQRDKAGFGSTGN